MTNILSRLARLESKLAPKTDHRASGVVTQNRDGSIEADGVHYPSWEVYERDGPITPFGVIVLPEKCLPQIAE
jgi:hypothetical protein